MASVLDQLHEYLRLGSRIRTFQNVILDSIGLAGKSCNVVWLLFYSSGPVPPDGMCRSIRHWIGFAHLFLRRGITLNRILDLDCKYADNDDRGLVIKKATEKAVIATLPAASPNPSPAPPQVQ